MQAAYLPGKASSSDSSNAVCQSASFTAALQLQGLYSLGASVILMWPFSHGLCLFCSGRSLQSTERSQHASILHGDMLVPGPQQLENGCKQPRAIKISGRIQAACPNVSARSVGSLQVAPGSTWAMLVCAGALKLVFATDTLAAGINMPARTTVISSLSRRRNVGHALLLHNELLQMAGRAGRRGFDTAGGPISPSLPLHKVSRQM